MNDRARSIRWWSDRLTGFLDPPGTSYEITRSLFLRGLGFIYLVAFLSLNRQVLALIGADGLLPAQLYLDSFRAFLHGSTWSGFVREPSLFWLGCSDPALVDWSWVGLGLSALVMAGATNALVMVALWFLYMSFVHVGQLFYGYGWETMTLEAGFLAIFLCPIRSLRPRPSRYPPPAAVLWFLRWMLFRVMFGAGLIKLRGDSCWRDLTCLAYHYETQPLPNSFSWYLHQLPLWFHQGGVLFNHFVELVVPWFYFAPRKLRRGAGLFTVIFQIILILSGNLSFLNWLTIVIAIPCFDDQALRCFRWTRRPGEPFPVPAAGELPAAVAAPARARKIVLSLLTVILLYLSRNPVLNMISPRQIMNTSFDPLHVMNTYGAFGSVGRQRYEIIIEGTEDPAPSDASDWREYEFLAKPGNPRRCPPIIAPYQSRIDWQIWFAAMNGDYRRDPWLIHFICKLLEGDARAIRLLKGNPFPQAPPRYIRAGLYRYQFTTWAERKSGWWKRQWVQVYLPPLSLENPSLRNFLHAYGWAD